MDADFRRSGSVHKLSAFISVHLRLISDQWMETSGAAIKEADRLIP